ncbi:Stk1 family PASTA domain-containing Ser/Thr kinase [Blastococcus sp. TF02-8]|uniref:Stk1 family PASTA domain-containing Ser/Thr kinase n=1 Tax=Blastococcus sp. TF02-8 TaxID=2250574 RepID=UPI000DE8F63C|nr:Stk1 family PASTA domain-containing Ser/Thr kinase [Blastococcus sp. TF02-8]RBY95579.1 Stk1 family PASTA domain-containing Ser/Thr kinase [Blastococcus sp. TF02-8]
MDTAVSDPVVGLVLEGRYRLEERLARGGMSTVYAATDLRLHKTVAVKVMAEHLAHDPAFVDRFTREARAAAMLSHPNVVGVSDQGSDQGLVFLVMELVRGRTLRDLLSARGRLTVAEAFAVLEPVLSGLTAAHRAGIVHRDIKPENVLIGIDGVVKVADFGLARAVVGTGQTSQTGGVLIGTVAYLSPEQLERGRADARSDIYAAGIVLYEMLTGHPPFGGDTPLAVAYQHVHHDVPAPSAEVPGLPWSVDELVARTTRRDPGGRPVDAGAFLAELASVRRDLGIDPVPVPTGQSAGPGTLRPTNRPTRPRPGDRHPSNPGTEVLGGRSGARGGRTSMLPGMGAGPTTDVQGRRPAPARPRPGVPEHIRRRRSRLLIAVVLLLAVTIGAVGWWMGSGRWTDVPSVAGKQEAAAVDLLQDAGLDPQQPVGEWSETVPAGVVISTDPASGEVIRGTDVTVLVSKGPERYTISPDLVGLPVEQVEKELEDLPIQVTRGEGYDDEIPPGSVIGFDPAAGTGLKRDQVVTVVVSQGRAPVAVPDVTGQTPEQAQSNLEKLGFTVERVEDGRSDAVDKGEVMAVAPGPADGPVPFGSAIRIQVSAGVPLVAVPDVVGKSGDEATQILQAAGLKVEATRFFGNSVLRQTPAAGEQVERGTSVTILLTFG